MGTCFSIADRSVTKKTPDTAAKDVDSGNHRCNKIRGVKKEEEEWIHKQALAAAVLLQRQMGNGHGTASFDRSASLRCPIGSANSNKDQFLPRSYSTRMPSLNDPMLQPHQSVNQGAKIDGLQSIHFVLVHGGGFGAWCWYKTMALLEEAGYKVTAVDLTGSGIHSSDTHSVTCLSHYATPLTDLLQNLTPGEEVILVGHDFGGVCISYAMEKHPAKVYKAIFVAAVMLSNGQTALDIFSEKVGVASTELMQQAKVFLHANGNDRPPTAISFHKHLLKDLLFNRSPAKDVALASVSMRPVPFSPVVEKLSLTEANHGSVRRYYIETTEDNAIPLGIQESMVNNCPPEEVFRLRGADHAPFFSKPLALHKLLVEISRDQRIRSVCSHQP